MGVVDEKADLLDLLLEATNDGVVDWDLIGIGKGSGQGLAQVHSAVVNVHGGSVRFDSRVGEGSCFIVSLPMGEAGQPKQGTLAALGVEGDRPAKRGCPASEPRKE